MVYTTFVVQLKKDIMSKKHILLVNDIAGYGKVATAAMLPILSYLGHPVYNLPTALVSNTLDYGKFNILVVSRLNVVRLSL